jgi:hypothetical protein
MRNRRNMKGYNQRPPDKLDDPWDLWMYRSFLLAKVVKRLGRDPDRIMRADKRQLQEWLREDEMRTRKKNQS